MLNRWTIAGMMVIGIAVVGVAVGGMLPSEPRPGVTKANFDRIKKRVTYAEVEDILGKPASSPGVVSFGATVIRWQTWTAEDGAQIHVTFIHDEAHKITWTDSTETVVQKVRRWMHLSK